MLAEMAQLKAQLAQVDSICYSMLCPADDNDI